MAAPKPNLRRRSLVVPREHGAWGLLLVPLVTGAAVGLKQGSGAFRLAPFTILALVLFWLRTPVESWAGTGSVRARTPDELRLVRTASFTLAGVALIAAGWLFWSGPSRQLLWLGLVACVAFLVQSAVKRAWRSGRTAAQMIGAAGLTVTAPAAYFVATSGLDLAAWSLWAANLLFAVNQIQYVHLRIETARVSTRSEKLAAGRAFLLGQIILIALVITACVARLFPWYAAPAFLPVLVRGFAWFASQPQALAVQKLGKNELLLSIVFALMLVAGMWLS